MKRIILSMSVIILAVSGVSRPMRAAQPSAMPDSLSAGQIDASDYSLMKRWRPKDAVPFVNDSFDDNMFIGVAGSGFRPLYPEFSSGPRFSLHIGKWFDAYNAVRIAPGLGYYFNNQNGQRVKQIDLKASWLFNMSSYLGGYRPSRFMEISTVAGLGYGYSWYGNSSMHSITAHLGLNFKMHVFQNVSLFLEPLVDLSFDGFGQTGTALPRKLMPYFCGTVGLSYNFGVDRRENIPEGDWFLFLAGGTQFQMTENVLHNMSMSDAFGFHGAFGGGRRYWNCFALRLSVAYSVNNWDTTLKGEGIRTRYLVGRLEAMLDLVALIGGRNDNRFCLSLLFGPEAGIMLKDKMARWMNPFVGMTGGIQAKTRLSRRFSIFIEPRMSFVPYPAPSGSKSPVNVNCHDGLFNCNVGVEFNL